MRPTLLGRISTAPKPNFEYSVKVHSADSLYFKQCLFASEVKMTDDEAIEKAKEMISVDPGDLWKVERI